MNKKEKPPVKIVALDLDGTLINSDKHVSERNRSALEKAAHNGIEIVPTTGRFYDGMPEEIRSMPFIHYAITVNGAEVLRIRDKQVLYRAELPLKQAISIMEYLDTQPVIYDCYMNGWGYMSQRLQEKAEAYAPDMHYLRMLRDLRTPVDELKEYLRGQERDVQKVMLFTNDLEARERMLQELPKLFPGIKVSSSTKNNIEINQGRANKGDALLALGRELGFTADNLMSFGDATNDLSMIEAAKYGIAMKNALPEVKKAAYYITKSNDEDGVAVALKHFGLI